jgi:hypothetical protein
MTLAIRKLASVACEAVGAALWLFVGLWAVRLLIRLARMMARRSRALAPSRH